MGARADQLVHPSLPTPLRWLGAATLLAAAVTAVAKLRERARQPSLRPMSDDWLQRHAADRVYHTYE